LWLLAQTGGHLYAQNVVNVVVLLPADYCLTELFQSGKCHCTIPTAETPVKQFYLGATSYHEVSYQSSIMQSASMFVDNHMLCIGTPIHNSGHQI
jgi:hypothetical protein